MLLLLLLLVLLIVVVVVVGSAVGVAALILCGMGKICAEEKTVCVKENSFVCPRSPTVSFVRSVIVLRSSSAPF